MPRPILLIAEDNHALRDTMASLLEEDYEVLEAEDGLVAVDLFRAHQPQLLLLDINMPGLDGVQVLEELTSEERAQSRTIVHSGHVDERTEGRCFELGAYTLLRKPSGLKEINECLTQALQDLGQLPSTP